MSNGPLLLPNLGAEEGEHWRRMRSAPPVASAARLWRCLFPAGTPALGDDPGDDLAVSEDEPGAAPAAAFDWLEARDGCIPWLSDASAWREAEAAGHAVRGAAGDVTRRVNDKAFALRTAEAAGFVPRVLRGTSVVLEPETLRDVDATIARAREAMDQWPGFARAAYTLKPRLGTSSRGRIDGNSAPNRADLSRLPNLADAGGAILEPWLERVRDLSAQLRVGDEGDVTLLGTLEQHTSPRGAVLGHRGEIDSRGRIFSGLPEDEAMREAAAAIAGAAGREGYTGPCGVDAFTFRWQDEAGEARQELRSVVELNARFTMGIVALGLARREIGDVRQHLGLRPGDRRAFELRFDAPNGGWQDAVERAGEHAFLKPLHREADVVRPAILFAQTRAHLADAFAGEAQQTERRQSK